MNGNISRHKTKNVKTQQQQQQQQQQNKKENIKFLVRPGNGRREIWYRILLRYLLAIKKTERIDCSQATVSM